MYLVKVRVNKILNNVVVFNSYENAIFEITHQNDKIFDCLPEKYQDIIFGEPKRVVIEKNYTYFIWGRVTASISKIKPLDEKEQTE